VEIINFSPFIQTCSALWTFFDWVWEDFRTSKVMPRAQEAEGVGGAECQAPHSHLYEASRMQSFASAEG
jgi:hypothetical protein